MTYNFSGFLQRSSRAIRLNENKDNRPFVIKEMCMRLAKFDDYCRHLAIKEWSKEFHVSERMLNSYICGDYEMQFTHTELLREHLMTFEITENEISGQVYIYKNEIQYTYEELTILVEEEGLRVYNLKKLLNSNNKNITVVKKVNPLRDFFMRLAEEYKNEFPIQDLASCIRAYDFHDKKNGFYQERMVRYLHKWMCKSVGQTFHIGSNDAMLLWLEPFGGSGKSQLNQWLFSLPQLQEYYIKIGENESFMDMKGISSSKFAIDWDELPLSHKRYLMFKSHVSADRGQVYDKIIKGYKQYIRQVNFCGSSNKSNREGQKGFLHDEDPAMMRRIASIEIDGKIDYKQYTKHIDLRQIWGQAAHDILQAEKSGNKSLLSWETDWDDLREQNKRYINVSAFDEREILKKYTPAEKSKGRFISSGEMIEELSASGIKISKNEMEIGHFLKRNKFVRVRKGTKRGYYVK